MKTMKQLLSLSLVLALCACMFAGCSSSTKEEPESTATTGNTETAVDTVESEDIIGQVTYVGTAYLSLTAYEAPDDVTDYAVLDVSTLTEAGGTKYVYPDENAEYYMVSSGTLVSATYEDIVKGCILAVTADDIGTQQIILLENNQEDEPEDTATEETGETLPESTCIVAEVTAVNTDGSLTLLEYVAAEDLALEDYTAVDLTQFTPGEITSEYRIPDDSLIYLAENGEMTELTADQIAVGDMLVIYTDDSAVTNILVYPPKAETEEIE